MEADWQGQMQVECEGNARLSLQDASLENACLGVFSLKADYISGAWNENVFLEMTICGSCIVTHEHGMFQLMRLEDLTSLGTGNPCQPQEKLMCLCGRGFEVAHLAVLWPH